MAERDNFFSAVRRSGTLPARNDLRLASSSAGHPSLPNEAELELSQHGPDLLRLPREFFGCGSAFFSACRIALRHLVELRQTRIDLGDAFGLFA